MYLITKIYIIRCRKSSDAYGKSIMKQNVISHFFSLLIRIISVMEKFTIEQTGFFYITMTAFRVCRKTKSNSSKVDHSLDHLVT